MPTGLCTALSCSGEQGTGGCTGPSLCGVPVGFQSLIRMGGLGWVGLGWVGEESGCWRSCLGWGAEAGAYALVVGLRMDGFLTEVQGLGLD